MPCVPVTIPGLAINPPPYLNCLRKKFRPPDSVKEYLSSNALVKLALIITTSGSNNLPPGCGGV